MVKLEVTPLIREAIELYNAKLGEDEEKRKIDPAAAFVTHNSLARIAIELNQDEKYSLGKLVSGSGVYLPPKPEKKVDPEYEARMNRLRISLQEQEYQSMIASTVPELATPFYESFNTKELKHQLSVIINILFSVMSVAVAVWMWAGANHSTGRRLLLSIFSGLIVLIAEVTLYIGYQQRMEDARNEERMKKEIKTVIKHEEILPRSLTEKKED
ncbi:endoplasmic reticulum-based factor for assembly of V-ATPase-domain-containing protein [Myxozyma melibiosi]|uniref:Endoplasmic reticulum-based factor for assembly of V-ATPase-domain-containing protein n=1 Tax=Myxozyma melibiosi TaxID=54550 RepID=A0ABR1FF47_9ASCO